MNASSVRDLYLRGMRVSARARAATAGLPRGRRRTVSPAWWLRGGTTIGCCAQGDLRRWQRPSPCLCPFSSSLPSLPAWGGREEVRVGEAWRLPNTRSGRRSPRTPAANSFSKKSSSAVRAIQSERCEIGALESRKGLMRVRIFRERELAPSSDRTAEGHDNRIDWAKNSNRVDIRCRISRRGDRGTASFVNTTCGAGAHAPVDEDRRSRKAHNCQASRK